MIVPGPVIAAQTWSDGAHKSPWFTEELVAKKQTGNWQTTWYKYDQTCAKAHFNAMVVAPDKLCYISAPNASTECQPANVLKHYNAFCILAMSYEASCDRFAKWSKNLC